MYFFGANGLFFMYTFALKSFVLNNLHFCTGLGGKASGLKDVMNISLELANN